MQQTESQLQEQVLAAQAAGTRLNIRGSGSKGFLLPEVAPADQSIDLTQYQGILSYEPTELVLTARAGTSLKAIADLLAEHQQLMPYDPPRFHHAGTLGGSVAAGFAGPSRPWRGAVRDSILGIRILDAQGRIASFGGQVIKNVAGYDISRLFCGSMGTLGLLLEISIRVIPMPRVERTLCLERSYEDAHALMIKLRRQPVPLTGACWLNQQLHLRLSASSDAALHKLQQTLGGNWADDNSFWSALRDQQLSFFTHTQGHNLWRVSIAPASPVPHQKMHLMDWGGAQHWIQLPQDAAPEKLLSCVKGNQGFVQPWFNALPVQHDSPVSARLKERLRAVFNANHLFNPSLSQSFIT